MTQESSDMQWYQGKTVLITGATSGIGRAMAKLLVEQGANVILCGRDREAMDSLKQECEAGPGQVKDEYLVNLSIPGAVRELCRRVQTHHQVNIVINNAGFGFNGEFVDMPEEVLNSMIAVNINAVTEFCKAFLPTLEQKKGNGIMNVGSVASFFPTPGSALYAATKHFVVGLTDALHHELSPLGVHITGLYPGKTHTKFIERASSGNIKVWDQAMTAEEVARSGLEGLAANKVRVVPKLNNQLKVLITKFFPIKTLLNVVSSKQPQNLKGKRDE